MIKNFLSLTKPGIIFGNLITVAAGFFLGCYKGHNHYGLLLLTLLGTTCIIASGCVFNNYIDRDIDRLMTRTKNRVLVQGVIKPRVALIYGTFLGLLGVLILSQVNQLTVTIALVGLLFYVVVYTLWFKRRTIYGVMVGSVSGATPPVIGYCAATGHFNLGALLLFLILSTWQMPHSYAIGMYRRSDYQAAKIPLLPLIKGFKTTKIHMLVYIVLFVLLNLSLTIFSYTGLLYFIVTLVLGIIWIRLAVKGFSVADNERWAKRMFAFSILCITLLSITMSINASCAHVMV